jgi:glycosyltransferase involved in cell wall biosynthesis
LQRHQLSREPRSKAKLGSRGGPGSALPGVTVVIPAYNMERYVERTLLSAVNQTYRNLKVLVVDDGSTDRTREIAERVARNHANLRVVSVPNGGVAAARNLGMEQADSLYVAFLDADDLWAPTKVEKQVASLAVHGHSEEWAASYALFRLIDTQDRVLDNGPTSRERGDFFEEHLVWNPLGNGSNLLVRRDAALAVGGFNSEYARAGIGGNEDLELQLKLLRSHKIELVSEYLIGYRLHAAQMSADTTMMRLGRIAVIERITSEGTPSLGVRERALVQAYTAAAKGFFLAGNWNEAANWGLASLRVSRRATALKVIGQARRELAQWWHRLTQSSVRKTDPLRPFYDFDPEEGLDPAISAKGPYRASWLGGARARSSSPLATAATQSDRIAADRSPLGRS